MSAIQLSRNVTDVFAAYIQPQTCPGTTFTCPVGQHCIDTGPDTHACIPNDNNNHINPDLTKAKQQSRIDQTPVVPKVTNAHPAPTTVATPKTANSCAGLTGASLTACQSGTSTLAPPLAHPCQGLTGSNLTACLNGNKTIPDTVPKSFANRNNPPTVKISNTSKHRSTKAPQSSPDHLNRIRHMHNTIQSSFTVDDPSFYSSTPSITNPSSTTAAPSNHLVGARFCKDGTLPPCADNNMPDFSTTPGGNVTAADPPQATPGGGSNTGTGIMAWIQSHMMLIVVGLVIYFLFFSGKKHRF